MDKNKSPERAESQCSEESLLPRTRPDLKTRPIVMTAPVGVPPGFIVPRKKRILATILPSLLLAAVLLPVTIHCAFVLWSQASRLDELLVTIERLQNDLRKLEDQIRLKESFVEQLRAFENGMADATDPEGIDVEEYGEEEEDPNDLVYTDESDYDIMEEKTNPENDETSSEEPLLPAGIRMRRSITPAGPPTPVQVDHPYESRERGVVLPRANRRLRLYHTLSRDTSAPHSRSSVGTRRTTPDNWSHKQSMFAEGPPMDYVTPPVFPRTPEVPFPPKSERRTHSHAHVHAARHKSDRILALDSRELDGGNSGQDLNESRAETLDTTVEVAHSTWKPFTPVVEGPAIAAHFSADTTRHRNSHHYGDNGRLKHPFGAYSDWRPSQWVNDLGMDHHFNVAEGGDTVMVNTPGLYFVYAQVNYANEKDENGFWLYRNNEKELLCVTSSTSHVRHSHPRANTCFTAGVLQLSRGDLISLRDLTGDRYRVLDHPGRSFVGLVNLHGCKLQSEQSARYGQKRDPREG